MKLYELLYIKAILGFGFSKGIITFSWFCLSHFMLKVALLKYNIKAYQYNYVTNKICQAHAFDLIR